MAYATQTQTRQIMLSMIYAITAAEMDGSMNYYQMKGWRMKVNDTTKQTEKTNSQVSQAEEQEKQESSKEITAADKTRLETSPDPMRGVVPIGDRLYITVARRIEDFRWDHPNWSLTTEMIKDADGYVQFKTVIADENKNIIGTGHAEEDRADGFINKTSAIENCETGSIGRALAACGYCTEFYASANEVSQAELKKEILKALHRGIEYGRAFEIHKATIETIQDSIASGDYSAGAEAWHELTDEEKKAIWLAPTKGGVFTTKEREIMKTNEFLQAHQEEPKNENI